LGWRGKTLEMEWIWLRKKKPKDKINLVEGKKTHGAFNLLVQVNLPPNK
jgi:hypothetical protein